MPNDPAQTPSALTRRAFLAATGAVASASLLPAPPAEAASAALQPPPPTDLDTVLIDGGCTAPRDADGLPAPWRPFGEWT